LLSDLIADDATVAALQVRAASGEPGD